MREALKRLQQSGLIRISQGGATRVRDWRRHGGLELLLELDEVPAGLGIERPVMEMRASVGADAARRCATRASAVVRAELEARAEMLAAETDLDARNTIYEAFWDLVIEGADNLLTGSRSTRWSPGSAAAFDARASPPSARPGAIRALAAVIAAGDPDEAHATRPRLLSVGPDGRGPLLRDPVLRAAAGGRGAVVPPLPRGRPRRLRAQRHADEHHDGPRQRDGQRRLEARRGRHLRRALRADSVPLPEDAWWVWILLFLADDLAYYWFHRVSHVSRFFWASHVVHHSSRHFNLSTALRQTWVPMTPAVLAAAAAWSASRVDGPARPVGSLIYQFGLHTERIGRLPRPLEVVFNTPSHHRVHHGANEQYLDRNYGGILIIWDRLFGTYPESERVRYGLTKNIDTFNPVKVAFGEYGSLVRDLRAAAAGGPAADRPARPLRGTRRRARVAVQGAKSAGVDEAAAQRLDHRLDLGRHAGRRAAPARAPGCRAGGELEVEAGGHGVGHRRLAPGVAGAAAQQHPPVRVADGLPVDGVDEVGAAQRAGLQVDVGIGAILVAPESSERRENMGTGQAFGHAPRICNPDTTP